MSQIIDIKITGFDGIKHALNQLPIELQRKAISVSVRAGANFLKEEIKNQFPKKPSKMANLYGHLKDNIAVRFSKKKSRAMGALIYELHPGKAFWAWMLEYGTKAHDITPKKAKALTVLGKFLSEVKVKGISARPIWRNTFDTKLNAIFMIIKNKFYSELPKAAKKLGFKGGYKIEGGTPIPTDIFGE